MLSRKGGDDHNPRLKVKYSLFAYDVNKTQCNCKLIVFTNIAEFLNIYCKNKITVVTFKS